MLELLVLFSQLLFNLFRGISNRALVKEKVLLSVLLTGAIQITWLLSTYLGLKGIFDTEPTLVISYLIGGMLGTYLNFKFKI